MVLDAFVRALSFYGGVPRPLPGSACLHEREGVIIDNPKTMVTYVSRSKDRTWLQLPVSLSAAQRQKHKRPDHCEVDQPENDPVAYWSRKI